MEQKKKNDTLNKVKKNLHEQKKNAIILRRAFGRPEKTARAKEMMAYLEVTNEVSEFLKKNCINRIDWFIVTLLARQLDMTNKMSMQDYLHDLYHDVDTSDSIKNKIAKLFEEKTDQRRLHDISWFIKYANNHEIFINEHTLYRDLTNWKDNAYNWAVRIVRKKENEQ